MIETNIERVTGYRVGKEFFADLKQAQIHAVGNMLAGAADYPLRIVEYAKEVIAILSFEPEPKPKPVCPQPPLKTAFTPPPPPYDGMDWPKPDVADPGSPQHFAPKPLL